MVAWYPALVHQKLFGSFIQIDFWMSSGFENHKAMHKPDMVFELDGAERCQINWATIAQYFDDIFIPLTLPAVIRNLLTNCFWQFVSMWTRLTWWTSHIIYALHHVYQNKFK